MAENSGDGWVELQPGENSEDLTGDDSSRIVPQTEINSKQEAAFEIGRLVKETFGDVFPEDVMILVSYETISRWEDTIVNKLQAMISEWDKKIEDDKSLYTLGLRRAIDIVLGNDPIM